MTGLELAEALRRVAALVEGQTRVQQLDMEPAPGLRVTFGVAPVGGRSNSSGSAERMRRKRERERDRHIDRHKASLVTSHRPSQSVTCDVTKGVTVTLPPPHTPSPFILPSDKNTGKEEERTDDARTNGRHIDRHIVTLSDVTDSDTATYVPHDLAEQAERLEVLADLARALKQPIESVRAAADEFVAYWAIGGGTGRKKTRWMRLLREHIRRGAAEGRLKPVGLVAHEQNTNGLPAGWSRHPNLEGLYLDAEGKTRRNLPRAS